MTASAAAGTSTGSTIISVIIFLIAVGLYFLPTIIAAARRLPDVIQVALLNFFLGWSVIGWIIALIWAAKPMPERAAG